VSYSTDMKESRRKLDSIKSEIISRKTNPHLWVGEVSSKTQAHENLVINFHVDPLTIVMGWREYVKATVETILVIKLHDHSNSFVPHSGAGMRIHYGKQNL